MPKKFNLLLFIVIYIIYMEFIFRTLIFKDFFSFSLVNIIKFSIPIGLLIYFLINIFKSKTNKIITYIFLWSFTIIFISQVVYFKTYDSIFSFSSTQNTFVIVEFLDFVVGKILKNIIGILFLLGPVIAFPFFKDKIFSFHKITIKSKLIIIIFILFGHFISINTLSNDGMYSDYNLYYNISAPSLTTNRLGLLTAMRLDISRLFFDYGSSTEIVNYQKEKEKEPKKIKVDKYNQLDINFDDLIANENDEVVSSMHKYFSTINPTNQNDYTGLFKGKNLIYILAESFDSIAIDKEVTPTLYKLATEGMYFSNFYVPLFPVSTTDGEYMTTTSLIPKEGVWSMYRSRDNYLPFVLGNMFKGFNYKTTAYHDHSANYYHRNLSHPNLGFEYYACGRGLDINCKIWPESDLEMVNATAQDYIGENPFMTYYITVSGHLQYSKYSAMVIKNRNYVKDLNYSERVRNYMADHIELDKALAKLISYLEAAGLAEDTVIAISPDHYPYGLTVDELNEKRKEKINDNFDRDQMPFIIWHKGITPMRVKKLGSSLDILPTLLNLYGFEYDSRLLMGKDMFSDNEPIVIFSNRSFVTDKGKFDALQNKFISNDDEEVSNEYLERMNQTVYNRFNISKLILEKDYYRQVFKP